MSSSSLSTPTSFVDMPAFSLLIVAVSSAETLSLEGDAIMLGQK